MFDSASSSPRASVWSTPSTAAESNGAPVVNAWLSALDVATMEGGSRAALAFTLAASSAVPLEAAIATVQGRAAIVHVLTASGWWGSSAFRLRLSESVLKRVADDRRLSRSQRAVQVAMLLRVLAGPAIAASQPSREAGETARVQSLQVTRDDGHTGVHEIRTLLAMRPDDAELRAFHALQCAHLNRLVRTRAGSVVPPSSTRPSAAQSLSAEPTSARFAADRMRSSRASHTAPALEDRACDATLLVLGRETHGQVDGFVERFAPTLGPGTSPLGSVDADTRDRESDNQGLYEVATDAGSQVAAGSADTDAPRTRQRGAPAEDAEPRDDSVPPAPWAAVTHDTVPAGFEPAPSARPTRTTGRRSARPAAWACGLIALAVSLPPAIDWATEWTVTRPTPRGLMPEPVARANPAVETAGPPSADLESLRRFGHERRRAEDLAELQRRVDRIEAALATGVLASSEQGTRLSPGSTFAPLTRRRESPERAVNALESPQRPGTAGMRQRAASSGPAGDTAAPNAPHAQIEQIEQSGAQVPEAAAEPGSVLAGSVARHSLASRPTFGLDRVDDEALPGAWPLDDALRRAFEDERKVEALARRLADADERLDVLEHAFERLRDRLAVAGDPQDRAATDSLLAMRRWADSCLAKVRALRAEMGGRAGTSERRPVGVP